MEALVSIPFIKLMRNPLTEQLIRHPNCLSLLTLVAYRARRSDEISLSGLVEGEAMMGDFDACGLTRQEFRTALNKLQAWGFVTTRATNRGTIVKLISSSVYDINSSTSNQQSNQQTTTKQPSDNQQATTNKKDKKEKNKPMSDSGSASSDDDGLSFDAFWQAYGRKEGSKAKMVKQWDALPVLTRQIILNGLREYRAAKTINGPQFMPMPQTFLNGKLWEAETYGKPAEVATVKPASPDPEADRLRQTAQRPAPVLEPQTSTSWQGYTSKPNAPIKVQEPAGQYAGLIH